MDMNPSTSPDGGAGSERDASHTEGPGNDNPERPDAGKTEGCKSECEPDDCGAVTDGCGDVLQCAAECPEGQGCGFDPARPNKCAFPPPVPCTPLDEATACAGKCGSVPDGCSGVYTCNETNGGVTCSDAQLCGGYDGNRKPNECVDVPRCEPATCASLGVECGQVGDGCGGVLDCTAEAGGCSGDKVCGTGANSGKCVDKPVCAPLAPEVACANACGVVGDGCDGTIDCEAHASTRCPTGQTCGGGGTPGQCGSGAACTPKSALEVCAGKCGYQPDGCGGSYLCTAENGGQTCDPNAGESCGGGDVPNQCGKPACTPKSEAEACPGQGGEKSCGLVPDGCGGLIDCGGCASDEVCGLTTRNVCADLPSCQPIPANQACAGKCGTVPNGCGGSYTCSAQNGGTTCAAPAFCGALSPNECGVPPTTCTPKTCAELGHTCGLAADGCGNVINCWPSCASDDPTCTGSCPDSIQACLADAATGAQSCIAGSASCTGPLCNDVPTTCSSSEPTRLTGVVKTPGRRNGNAWVNQIAVPNAVVYIPADPNAALPAIFEGVSANDPRSCARCEDEELVVDGDAILAAAVTDYKGEFTLSGRIPVGVPFKLVVKIGKWRRVVEVPANVAASCQARSLDLEFTRLPRNKNDGLSGTHIPKIAVSTGEVDEMECVLRGIGLDDSEFTVPSGNGRVHMYRANGAHMPECTGTFFAHIFDWYRPCANDNNYGCRNGEAGCSWGSVSDTQLLASQATLNNYDMIVFDCEGEGIDRDASVDARLASYARNGGRIFASHWSYYWLKDHADLRASATWVVPSGSYPESGVGRVSLQPTRPRANPIKSLVFRDWLDWQGALTGTNAGQLDDPSDPRFDIREPRDHASSVAEGADEWVYRTFSNTSSVQQFSYNMPFDGIADNACGRVAYSGFHVASASNGGSNAVFPGVCSNGELSAQEKVLVFMLFDLAACVSEGEPPRPPECTPKTAQDLCPAENDACGFLSDGCGGVVDCGGCADGFYCDGTTCRPQECVPASCASLGYNCGEHPDGCGGIARNAQGQPGCGECLDNQVCGVGGPGVCGSTSCPPIPRDEACPPNACGLASDGCGGTYDCGTCPDGAVCGGGGPNLCGPGSCLPEPREDACDGKNCGLVSDGCGGTYDCGECVLPDTCGGGGVPNVCGHPTCTPYADPCDGLECGKVADGCGGVVDCGDCPDGRICGGAGPNLCGAACEPTTCEAEGAECGAISDACGGVLNCGPCTNPGETCGAAGPNKCGGGTCTPTTCDAEGAECGLIGDGCGNVLDCGICTKPGESCGGAGVPNQCGPGTGGCNPLRCEVQGVECGAAGDGCGGVLNCGTCDEHSYCERGKCEPIIVVK